MHKRPLKHNIMAKNSALISQNQAFLAQHERLRLNKPCNRIIDLRGKVAGECLAYHFGGKTHYLNDRAYLVIKTLLERSKGKYTVGVYETLFKAIKPLSASDDTKAEKEPEFLLKRNRSEIQFIPFKNPLQRKEERIIFATPVEIHVADVLYHGITVDISTSAISVVLKRVSTLESGDNVLVNFIELVADPALIQLSQVTYSVLNIKHDNLRSSLVLVRDPNESISVTQQLAHWCKQHNSLEHLDLDNRLFNIAASYYQHLYYRFLTSPQIWLTINDSDTPIQAFHLTPAAHVTLEALRTEHGIDFSLLPVNEILANRGDLLLQISSQQAHVAYRNIPSQVALLLHYHRSQASSHILLIKTHKIAINPQDFYSEIAQIAENNPDYATTLKHRLNTIKMLASITDISTCCTLLEPSSKQDGIINKVKWQGKGSTPSYLNYDISRKYERFVIHTPIRIHANNTQFEAITDDVSTCGLAFTLQGDSILSVGDRIAVDFVRWQQQTSRISLKKLIYHVRNIRVWNGKTHIGLERDKTGASQAVNSFFESTINRNKQKLITDNHDTITTQETEIYSSLLSQTLSTTPFYLGMDNDNKRIIQAAISGNNGLDDTFWQALQAQVTLMTKQLNSLPYNTEKSVHFGIYCARDNEKRWLITTDYEFESAHEKALCISRALTQKHYYFFHCRLTPIKPSWFDQETRLNHQLNKLRRHSPHKVKQIKSIMLSFFAIGELTDITDIIRSN